MAIILIAGKCDAREILFYENFDLETIQTPVDADRFESLLMQANYPEEKTQFLIDGFRNGFTLGYNNKNKVRMKSPNLKLTIGDEIDLWNKVMKEVKLGRYAGPFKEIPEEFADDFIQSPIGLVPKDDGKNTRLIFY